MTSDLQQLLDELYSLQRLGIKTGLEHTVQLLEACGDPHQDLNMIHIAGTNGKGSTAAFIFNILRSSEYKVGLYTSPHLIRFNERIRVDGLPIPDAVIVEFMDKYSDDIKKIESTFFETTTAMAFWYFAQQDVDIAVIETGLGGRLDSTNVIDPLVSVITSISMDHQELLGDDIKTIAIEKAGIIKQNIPVICSDQKETVKQVLTSKAKEMNADISFVKPIHDHSIDINGMTFMNNGQEFHIPLLGEHQLVNACLALKVINNCFNEIDPISIRSGFNNTQWPGRLQLLFKEPPVFYDVAHNEQGIEKILNTLSTLCDHKPIGLFALKEDKELQNIAKKIKNAFHRLLTIDDNDQLLMNKNILSEKLNNYGIDSTPVDNINSFHSMLTSDTPGVIFGSHYIANAIFEEFHFSFDTGVI